MKKWKVVLGLASQSVPQKIDQARLIIESMSDNDYFPNPTPKLIDVSKKVAELQKAYTLSRDAGKEQTADMHTKSFNLDIDLIALGNYVQDTANKDNEIGDVIIFSAGMDVKKDAGAKKRTFNVVNTATDGRVKLQTISEGRAAYVWEYSLDQEDWTSGGVTTQASTVINGLLSGKRYYFRVASITDEQGPWLGPINLIVT
ncbi:MAG: hypothetical protein J5I47_05595 [Vicingus serpentipes]|nr:hypothetical protein [Vicingus serpentipes]